MFFNQNLDFLTLTVKSHENQGKVHPLLVFIAKQFFFHCSATPVVGVTLGELEKLFFLNTIHPFFEEHHLIPLVFIAKWVFLIVLRHRSWGYPSVSLNKSCFLIQYEKKLIISGDIRNYIF